MNTILFLELFACRLYMEPIVKTYRGSLYKGFIIRFTKTQFGCTKLHLFTHNI